MNDHPTPTAPLRFIDEAVDVPAACWVVLDEPRGQSPLSSFGGSRDELYAACREDVQKVHPSAHELARGLSYVAIMVGKELIGSGSTSDRAWADAYGRLTWQV